MDFERKTNCISARGHAFPDEYINCQSLINVIEIFEFNKYFRLIVSLVQ